MRCRGKNAEPGDGKGPPTVLSPGFLSEIQGLDVISCFLASAMFCLADASKHARASFLACLGLWCHCAQGSCQNGCGFPSDRVHFTPQHPCFEMVMSQAQLLCTLYLTESNLGRQSFGGRKDSFIAWSGTGGTQQANAPKNQVSQLGEDSDKFYNNCSKGRDQLVDFLLDGLLMRQLQSPPSAPTGMRSTKVGSIPLLIINFFHLERGFQYLQGSLKECYCMYLTLRGNRTLLQTALGYCFLRPPFLPSSCLNLQLEVREVHEG